MTEIVTFLTARLDEDQAAAEATTPVPVLGQWRAARDKHAPASALLHLIQGTDLPENETDGAEYASTPIIAYSAEWQDEAEANLRHIARHDPGRVLAEVAAKRAIVAMHEQAETWTWEPRPSGTPVQEPRREAAGYCGTCQVDDGVIHGSWPCDTLMHLASVYADHTDFDESWRP